MDKVYFKQTKPLTVKILGAFLLVVWLFLLVGYNAPFSQIMILGFLAILITGYRWTYTIDKDYNVKKVFDLFGAPIFALTMNVFYPDYVTLFSASFKQNADWGSIAALGKERQNVFFVVRIFKGNQHYTFFKSTSYQRAEAKAIEFSKFLDVEYRSKIK